MNSSAYIQKISSVSTVWKTLFLILPLFLWAFLSHAKAAEEDPTSSDYLFYEGVRAYDENRFPEAIRNFELLAQQGQALPSVLFNLGNSYYRNGNMGPAIRAYRQAQMAAPRDPDINANLKMAAQTAGVTLPKHPAWMAFLLHYNRMEWIILFAASFWVLMFLCGAVILRSSLRGIFLPLKMIAAVLILLACAGLWQYRDLRIRPEWVVLSGNQKAYAAPLTNSVALLALPEGSIVRQRKQQASWIEIQTEGHLAWIPATSAAPILGP